MPGIVASRCACGSIRFFSSSRRSFAKETASKHVLRDYNVTTTYRYSLLDEQPPQVQAYPWATPATLRRVRAPPRRVKMVAREYGLLVDDWDLTNRVPVSYTTVSTTPITATSPSEPESSVLPTHFNSLESKTVLNTIASSPMPLTNSKIPLNRNIILQALDKFSTHQQNYSNHTTARPWHDTYCNNIEYITTHIPIYPSTKSAAVMGP
jgi:hypothetical protein